MVEHVLYFAMNQNKEPKSGERSGESLMPSCHTDSIRPAFVVGCPYRNAAASTENIGQTRGKPEESLGTTALQLSAHNIVLQTTGNAGAIARKVCYCARQMYRNQTHLENVKYIESRGPCTNIPQHIGRLNMAAVMQFTNCTSIVPSNISTNK